MFHSEFSFTLFVFESTNNELNSTNTFIRKLKKSYFEIMKCYMK